MELSITKIVPCCTNSYNINIIFNGKSVIVYGRSLTGIVGSNPALGMDVCLLWVWCVVR
jgi:hypothetical protein